MPYLLQDMEFQMELNIGMLKIHGVQSGDKKDISE
jgi:hypothetical protein